MSAATREKLTAVLNQLFPESTARKAKIGSNRGKARLWLEGQWLAEAGFTVGTRFTAEIKSAQITLRTSEDGERKVSGKGSKPIIDINTDKLTVVAPAQSHIELRVGQGIIQGQPSSQELETAA